MLLKYAQIERSLAALHNVPDAKMKAFRARIRNYQKIGLVPSSPGKGKKIVYSQIDASIWAICFELEEVGLAPEACKKVFDALSTSILDFFRNTQDKDQYLVLIGLFLEWRLNGNFDQGLAHDSGLYSMEAIKRKGFIDHCQRLVLINLSSVKRKLLNALGEELRDDTK